MKTYSQTLKMTAGCLLALATLMTTTRLGAAYAQDQTEHSSSATGTATAGGGGGGGGGGRGAVSSRSDIVINSIEPTAGDELLKRKDRSWLGVAVEEGSEALESQLALEPGSGLVVNFVTPDSPAAKAGLQKNDVLVELEGQLLVHPAQLRKLVQSRKEGATIGLVFYRAGKKETASATLQKAPAGFGLLDDGRSWDGDLRLLWDTSAPDALRQQMKTLGDSVGKVKIDQAKVEAQVRRSLDHARKAMQDSLRHSSNTGWGPTSKAFKELEKSGVFVDNNASVTVRTTGKRVKSLVKADESGSIVLVCNPKPRLTAHDKDGKLLFDGEIDTPEQRATVPPELLEKVEPLLDKVAPQAEDEPEAKPALPKKPARPDKPPRAPLPPRTGPTF